MSTIWGAYQFQAFSALFLQEYFKHFYEHFTFGETDWSKRGKRLEKYVRVAIAIELVTVGTKLEDL